jgi:hypothetical protein
MTRHEPPATFKGSKVRAATSKPQRARGRYRLEPDVARVARTLTALVRAHAAAGYGQGHAERILIDADGVFVTGRDETGYGGRSLGGGHNPAARRLPSRSCSPPSARACSTPCGRWRPSCSRKMTSKMLHKMIGWVATTQIAERPGCSPGAAGLSKMSGNQRRALVELLENLRTCKLPTVGETT